MTRLQIIFMTLTLRWLFFISKQVTKDNLGKDELGSLAKATNDFAHLCNEHPSTLEAKKELEADNEV